MGAIRRLLAGVTGRASSGGGGSRGGSSPSSAAAAGFVAGSLTSRDDDYYDYHYDKHHHAAADWFLFIFLVGVFLVAAFFVLALSFACIGAALKSGKDKAQPLEDRLAVLKGAVSQNQGGLVRDFGATG